MKTRTLVVAAAVTALAALLFLVPVGEVVSQTIQQVFITNFPEVQTVRGRVDVATPVRLSKMQRIEEIIVPPIQRTETTRLVHAGNIVTDGFPSVVLSLHGTTKGTVVNPGNVGAILLPEEPTIQEALFEQGELHFNLEVISEAIHSRTAYFGSNQPIYRVGFTDYRVLLYNTTDKTVTVNIYAYLTN